MHILPRIIIMLELILGGSVDFRGVNMKICCYFWWLSFLILFVLARRALRSMFSSWSSSSRFFKGLFRVEMHSLLYVPVQTIVSPCDAKCVTPLIYPSTDLDFLFGMIVSFDLSFYFLFFETCTQPFLLTALSHHCNYHITRHVLYTGKCTRLYTGYFRDHKKRDHYVFYEHVDTSISSLSYYKN